MRVAVVESKGLYPGEAPYHPSVMYPEYLSGEISAVPNAAYAAVRESLFQLGYDKNNYNKPDWNPLAEIVKPGDTVFVKPNLVDDKHRHGGDVWSVITHPSVVRAVCDYVGIALQGRGKIIIGDNPHVDADFQAIGKLCGFEKIREYLESKFGIQCEIIDLRFKHTDDLEKYGYESGCRQLSGDTSGVVRVDLGKKSFFCGLCPLLFRGTFQKRWGTIKHHIFGKHEYYFSRTIFDADVYISVPKLKTHAKVGATLNIKGLVGTIANKNALVHWRIGYPVFGGDEYPPPKKRIDCLKLYFQHLYTDLLPEGLLLKLKKKYGKSELGKWFRDLVNTNHQKTRMLRGAWQGNDTTWRMAADVYLAFVKDVTQARKKPMRFFSVVDGIIAGEKNGPHFPRRVEAKTIISGEDILAVDLTAARTMGFDPEQVKYLLYLMKTYIPDYKDKIKVMYDNMIFESYFSEDNRNKYLDFCVPDRWQKMK